MHRASFLLLSITSIGSSLGFDPLEHLGANSPWFAGPNVNQISPAVPDECSVDQAVYIARHGSRYPTPGAYAEWQALHDAFQSATFYVSEPLDFISNWSPVLPYPEQEIDQLSLTGWKESYNLGVDLRLRYPGFHKDNTPFMLWADQSQRVVNTARLFARGYLGPNATTEGSVYVVNPDPPSAVGNSLTPSDKCPNFKDSGGGSYASEWESIYLPPITERLNKLIRGNLTLSDGQVSIFPYLCGFETQIMGRVSPWCHLFTEEETRQYEYRQDLRYYYGTGPGVGNNMTVMLPVLQGVVDLLQQGPGVSAQTSNGSMELPQLIMAFTHDNEINELASIVGIFDEQEDLPSDKMDRNRIYQSSYINPMRGTVAFERMNCTQGGERVSSVRIRLNDAVYPISSCQSGPGRSCPVADYAQYVSKKRQESGSFAEVCGLPTSNVSTAEDGAVTFFRDLTLPLLRVVEP